MTEENKLKELYEQKFLPILKKVEQGYQAKKRSERQIVISIILMIVSWIPPVIFLSGITLMIVITCEMIIGAVVINSFYFESQHNDYNDTYQKQIIKPVLSLVMPAWHYHFDQTMSQEKFDQSQLIRKSFSCYNGYNLISGPLENGSFEFSRIHLEERKESDDEYCSIDVFQGLLLIITCKRSFPEQMFITPRDKLRNFTPLEEKGKNWFAKSKEIPPLELHRSAFDDQFAIHVLPPPDQTLPVPQSLIDALLTFKQKYPCDLALSFIDNKVYCTIGTKIKNLFTPGVGLFGIQYSTIKAAQDQILMVNEFLNVLDTNIHLWDKNTTN
ncbi:MAG TPA: hypothetical protein DCS93_10620 [Microscillaceae bacterium]|nr:hypothetical protein [Microscillaceae bacterium]